MNVLADLVERGYFHKLDDKWNKRIRVVVARLNILHQPLGWAVALQDQDLVLFPGTREVLLVFVPKYNF